MCMNMNSKLTIRVTEHQLKLIKNHLLSEQNDKQGHTKSSLIREVLNEYFDKTCRNPCLIEKPDKKPKIKDMIRPILKKLKLMNFK